MSVEERVVGGPWVSTQPKVFALGWDSSNRRQRARHRRAILAALVNGYRFVDGGCGRIDRDTFVTMEIP